MSDANNDSLDGSMFDRDDETDINISQSLGLGRKKGEVPPLSQSSKSKQSQNKK